MPLTEIVLAGRITVALLAVIAAVLVVAALKLLSVIVIPPVIALFTVLLVYPVQQRVNNRLPKGFSWAGVTAAMLVFVAVLAVFAGLIGLIVASAAGGAEQYAAGLRSFWAGIVAWSAAHHIPVPADIMRRGEVLSGAVKILTAGFSSIWSLGAMSVIVFFLVLLLLTEADHLKSRFAGRGIAAVAENVAGRVRVFLLFRTVISLVSGIMGGLWLWLIGADQAFAWGVLIFLLNYVPYVGSIIAVIPPTLLTLVQYGPGKGALALGGLAVIDQIIGNYIDPRIEGRIFTLSPTAVFIAVLFWGWVWGTAGALLAVPITITLMTVYAQIRHYPGFEFLFGGADRGPAAMPDAGNAEAGRPRQGREGR